MYWTCRISQQWMRQWFTVKKRERNRKHPIESEAVSVLNMLPWWLAVNWGCHYYCCCCSYCYDSFLFVFLRLWLFRMILSPQQLRSQQWIFVVVVIFVLVIFIMRWCLWVCDWVDGNIACDLAEFTGIFFHWRLIGWVSRGRGWFRWSEEDVAVPTRHSAPILMICGRESPWWSWFDGQFWG